MLSAYQTTVVAYYDGSGGLYHLPQCAYQIDEPLWDQIAEKFEEDDSWRSWEDSVAQRFAEALDGSLVIRYEIDEMESQNLDSEIDYVLQNSFGDFPEALQEYLDEYFHDGIDTGDLPANEVGWTQLIRDWIWDNSEEAGLGFVYCEHCSERIS